MESRSTDSGIVYPNSSGDTGWSAAFTEKRIIWLAIVAGVIERGAWSLLRHTIGTGGEARNVAVAIASGRGFADAFHPGQGPTDHISPGMPLIAGAVYAVLGIRTPSAETVLWAMSVAMSIGSYLLYYRAFGRLGVPRWARLAVLCFLCIAPTYFQPEAVDFRAWSGGITALLGAFFFDRLVALNERPTIGIRSIIGMACLAAIIFFTTPPFGIGIYAAAGLFCLLRLRGRQLFEAVVISSAALALIVSVWGIRNYYVMGTFLPLRDNAGLELAMAQYDGALAPLDGGERRLARFKVVSPIWGGYDRMMEMGEVAYSNMLGDQAKQWMRNHPGQVLQVMGMHLRQIITPPRWMFTWWQTQRLATLRSLLASMVGIFGLAGLIAGMAIRRQGWWYVGALLALPMAAFVIYQPLARYIYLFYAPLAFSATGLLFALQRLRDRGRSAIAVS